jgi:hypothetical protein
MGIVMALALDICDRDSINCVVENLSIIDQTPWIFFFQQVNELIISEK